MTTSKRFALMCVFVVGAAAMLLAQHTKYEVTANAEKGVDFAKFKTYTWTKGQPSAVKEINARIMDAVDRQLSDLGMTKNAAEPSDVLVAYYSLTRTDVNLKAKADASGALPQYSVGSLMVALLEPGSRRRLLRLRIDKPIDTAPDKLGDAIDGAVAELFTKYPTRER